LEYLEELLNALCTKAIKGAFAKKKEELVTVPLKEWLDLLKASRADDGVLDVGSVEEYLKSLQVATHEDLILSIDLRKSSEKIDGVLRHIKRPSNNL